MDYLINICGVKTERLSQKGWSFDKPVAPNTTEENMQKNRRVEVFIKPSGTVQLDRTGTDNPGTVEKTVTSPEKPATPKTEPGIK